MRFNRPAFIPILFFVGAMITTVGLGTWQVERLHWKTKLIADIAAANAAAPLTTLPKDEAELNADAFRRVALKGTWVANTEFTLVPRYFHNQLGYGIITPLKLTDGRIILINRGWVPARKKDPAKRPETTVKGSTTINGLLRIGRERNYFTPKNQPERNLWFGRDADAMGEAARLNNVIPATVDLIGTQSWEHLPVPSDGTIRLRNDHLSYVITWYAIALGILIIFLAYHRRRD